MTKKITISVPDELHEKMEKWKESFNFSRVFQEAISEKIQRKEDFQERLKGGSNMQTIIERLKEEKIKSGEDYYEEGKKDGLEWAKAAHYDEIQYALQWETVKDIQQHQPGLFATDPTKDEVLGEYFGEVMKEDLYMGFDTNHDMPNDHFIAWEIGWKEGIEAFWNEVAEHL